MPSIRRNKPLPVQRRVLQTGLFTLFLATLITSHQAGIIDSILQHKYRTLAGTLSNTSLELPLDHMNASSTSVLEHFEGRDGQTTSVEYQSPIQKIIDIISGKPRSVIVVEQHKSVEPETAQSSLPPEMASIEPMALNLDQNWAIIGPAERYIPQGHGGSVIPQASHSMEQIDQLRPDMGEHQQFQQIYTSQHLNELERQILERAASVQNRPQSIYLGSYLPQQVVGPLQAAHSSPLIIPSPMSQRPTMAPRVLLRPVLTTTTTTTTTPDTRTDPEQESGKESGEDSGDHEAGDDKTEESSNRSEPHIGESRPAPAEAGGNRDEDNETSPEESKSGESKVDPDEQGDDEPNSDTSNRGTSHYHENYDSDTMDEPLSTSSNSDDSDVQPVGESSNNVLTGLISVGLNDDCLQCICRASSGCDYLLRCITRGADEKYCGPFQITEDYWKSAGSPGDSPNNFSAFEECANEADCAVETVTNYMKRFHKDCDGDGNITCLDYARLHKLRPDECDNTEKLADTNHDAYWAKFQRCAEGYNRSRTRQDEEDM